MTPRIITADEAKTLLDAATPGPWNDERIGADGDGSPCSHEHQLCNADGIAVAIITHDGAPGARANDRLLAAAPDLAATVVAQATEYLALAKRMDDRGFELRAAKVEAHTARHLLATLADAVRRERDARAEWLDSLPDGSCGNQPPAALLNAETATGEALRAIEEPR